MRFPNDLEQRNTLRKIGLGLPGRRNFFLVSRFTALCPGILAGRIRREQIVFFLWKGCRPGAFVCSLRLRTFNLHQNSKVI